jgi:TfoX/Sxy family transcriptional regulator of competence genes
MLTKEVPMPISQDVLDIYDRLIATLPQVQRRGATMPYTSLNGHMFSFLTPEGHLALRLPSSERQAFLAKYHTSLCEQHGKVLEEYAEVPDSLFRNVDELVQHFRTSYTHVNSLKPKPTTRRTRT